MEDGALAPGDALPHDRQLDRRLDGGARRRPRPGRRSRRAPAWSKAGRARWLTTSSAQSRPCASRTASSIGSGCGTAARISSRCRSTVRICASALGQLQRVGRRRLLARRRGSGTDSARGGPRRATGRRPDGLGVRTRRRPGLGPRRRSTSAVSRADRPAAVLAHPHHRRSAVPFAACRHRPVRRPCPVPAGSGSRRAARWCPGRRRSGPRRAVGGPLGGRSLAGTP